MVGNQGNSTIGRNKWPKANSTESLSQCKCGLRNKDEDLGLARVDNLFKAGSEGDRVSPEGHWSLSVSKTGAMPWIEQVSNESVGEKERLSRAWSSEEEGPKRMET